MSVRQRLAAVAATLLVSVSGLALASSPSVAAAGPAVTATPPAAAAVPVGTYRIRNLERPGECLQADPRTAPAIGTAMAMVPCGDSVYQRWLFGSANPSFPAGFNEVRNAAGRCLDAHDRGGVVHGNIIHLYDCNKSANQAWAFSVPPSQGVVCMWRAHLCDKVLDQQLYYTAGLGYRVHLMNTHGRANQTWYVEAVS